MARCVVFILQDLLQLLRNKTGIPNLSFIDIWYIEDTLLIEVYVSLTP